MPVPDSFVPFVNPLQGTDSSEAFSTGSTLPLVARPFGMTHWTPQTDMGRWIFTKRAPKLQGIRATHQPSPWIGDYGPLLLLPQTGPRILDPEARASSYPQGQSVFSPTCFRTRLLRYQTEVACTATTRAGMLQMLFPSDQPARLLLEFLPGEGVIEVDAERAEIRGVTRAEEDGNDHGGVYYVARFDRPFREAILYERGREQAAGSRHIEGHAVGASVEFGSGDSLATVRIGTSFIGFEAAAWNLEQEVGSRSFEELEREGAQVWDELLGRIRIESASDEELRTFYSCLYRVLLFPRKLHEFDRSGAMVHRSPYDGQIHPGRLYSDHGFWDTFRTVYSVFALAYPDVYEAVLEGWMQAYRESGWFPKWPSPGHRGSMTGTHLDSVFAEALAKGIPFPVEEAYAGLLKHARFPGPPGTGRPGIEAFNELGYVPADASRHAVAETLDHAFGNFCIGRLAEVCGKEADRRFLEESSQAYRALYDPVTGFMRARRTDGSWLEPFDEFAWGGPYVEGGAWQWTWAVPHDPDGLIELMGGRERFVERLETMLTMPPTFRVGFYSREIHEMTEMGAAGFGQYAQSNQPVHHVLFLFSAAGRPELAQFWVRRVLRELYSADGFPGDEDNGEMAGWYVLNALGLFPLCPATGEYYFSSPLFRRVEIHSPGRQPLRIETDRQDDGCPCVESVSLAGRPYAAPKIAHAELVASASLRFSMGSMRDR